MYGIARLPAEDLKTLRVLSVIGGRIGLDWIGRIGTVGKGFLLVLTLVSVGYLDYLYLYLVGR